MRCIRDHHGVVRTTQSESTSHRVCRFSRIWSRLCNSDLRSCTPCGQPCGQPGSFRGSTTARRRSSTIGRPASPPRSIGCPRRRHATRPAAMGLASTPSTATYYCCCSYSLQELCFYSNRGDERLARWSGPAPRQPTTRDVRGTDDVRAGTPTPGNTTAGVWSYGGTPRGLRRARLSCRRPRSAVPDITVAQLHRTARFHLSHRMTRDRGGLLDEVPCRPRRPRRRRRLGGQVAADPAAGAGARRDPARGRRDRR